MSEADFSAESLPADGIPLSQRSPPPSPSDEATPASLPVLDSPIVLQVGEREFRTQLSTLTGESAYFASLLSGRWAGSHSSAEHKLFIDADPDLFQHILHYLRRGVFPLFWKKHEGFDYGLYTSLLQEVRYFGIQNLADWISEKKYLEAVTIEYSARQVEGSYSDHANLSSYNATLGSHLERSFHTSWKTKTRYKCPRGIDVHDGDPHRCGRACNNAKVEGVSNYEDFDVVHTLIVDKKTVVNDKACLGDSEKL